MSGFYKMDPAAWDFGTTNLSLEEEAAYLRVVNAIHKHDAPVPDNDRVIAGLFRVSTRKARSLIVALVSCGKLIIEDGKIWNERARSDLAHRGFTSAARAESGAKGGKARAANAAASTPVHHQFTTISTPEPVVNPQRTDSDGDTNVLKTNESYQASASSRIEKNREEKKEEAKASSKERGSRLSQDWQLPPDWDAWAIAEGLANPEAQAARFRDYWISQPGRYGVRTNWLATWRNWVRKAISDAGSKPTRKAEPHAGDWRQLPDGRQQQYEGAYSGWVTVV